MSGPVAPWLDPALMGDDPWTRLAESRSAGRKLVEARRREEDRLNKTVSIKDQLEWQSACAKAKEAGLPLPPPPTGRPVAEDPAPTVRVPRTLVPTASPRPPARLDVAGASMSTSTPALNGSRPSTIEKRAERAKILANLAAEAADLRAVKCANVPDIAAALGLSRSAVNYALSARYGSAVATSEKIVAHLRALPAPTAEQRAEYERRSACALRATKGGGRPRRVDSPAAPASSTAAEAAGGATFDGVSSVLSGLRMPEIPPAAYPPVRFNGPKCTYPGESITIPLNGTMTFTPEKQDVHAQSVWEMDVLEVARRVRQLRVDLAAAEKSLLVLLSA